MWETSSLLISNLLSAVVNALRNLQRKINQMELEKKQAETHYQQLSHDVAKGQQAPTPSVEPVPPTGSQPGSNSCSREGDVSSPVIASQVMRTFGV